MEEAENHMSWSDGFDGSYSNAWRYSYEGHYVVSGILFDLVREKYARYYEDGEIESNTNQYQISGHLHVSNGKIDYICIEAEKLYPLQ